MKNDVIVVMEEYNKQIAGLKAFEDFLDDENVSMSQKEKNIPRVQELSNKISKKLQYFEDNKIKYTDIEALNGFNIEYRKQRFKRYGY